MYVSNCQKLLSIWKWFYSSRLDSFMSILSWPRFVLECTMNLSRFEETCIRQTARTCFHYGNDFFSVGWIYLYWAGHFLRLLSLWDWFYTSRLDGFVSILSWPLMTTKSNHCQHLNCAIQIGNVEGEQWREGTLWLVIWSIVDCVRIL